MLNASKVLSIQETEIFRPNISYIFSLCQIILAYTIYWFSFQVLIWINKFWAYLTENPLWFINSAPDGFDYGSMVSLEKSDSDAHGQRLSWGHSHDQFMSF